MIILFGQWVMGTALSVGKILGSQNIEPLINHIPASVNFVSDCSLNDMIIEEDTWNLELFRV